MLFYCPNFHLLQPMLQFFNLHFIQQNCHSQLPCFCNQLAQNCALVVGTYMSYSSHVRASHWLHFAPSICDTTSSVCLHTNSGSCCACACCASHDFSCASNSLVSELFCYNVAYASQPIVAVSLDVSAQTVSTCPANDCNPSLILSCSSMMSIPFPFTWLKASSASCHKTAATIFFEMLA